MSNEVKVRTGYMLKNFVCYAEVFELHLKDMKRKNTGERTELRKK